MMTSFLQAKERVYGSLKDQTMQAGVQRGMDSFLQNIKAVRSKVEAKSVAEEICSLRKENLHRLPELVKEALDSLQRNGVQTFLAKGKEDALQKLGEWLQDEKLIVKSKSMVGEELGLRRFLQSKGKEVWETDLGEFIIQLKGDRPAQMVAPSLHVPREEVAELFSKFFQISFENDQLEEMVAAAREFLREKILHAEAGITGANAISAAEGTVVTVENEGNLRLTMTLPRKHIVLSSVEKVVPDTIDAVRVALAQSYYAGYTKPTYISLTSTPSGTGDIEKTMVRPAQGSKEMYVMLVDNGRFDALQTQFMEALKCIKCGACQMVCPTFALAGPAWGGEVYSSAIGLIWTLITEGAESIEEMSYFCTGCGACNDICPVRIDVRGLIWEMKRMASRNWSGE